MSLSLLGTISSGTTGLNNDLISKLKTNETNSINKNLEKKLSNIDSGTTILDTFQTKLQTLLSNVKTSTTEFSGNISNNNISFNIIDKNVLKEDSLSFNVKTLAKKDVYQTKTFTNNSDLYTDGDFSIKGQTINTTNKSYQNIVDELNKIDGVSASIDIVAPNQKRIIVKSINAGTENSLNSSLEKVQSASNLSLTIDGVNTEFNSNSFVYNNLQIDVNKEGESTINIKKDSTEIKSKIDNFINNYNDLNTFANDSILYNKDFNLNKDTVKSILSDIKSSLFDNKAYTNGFSLNKDGSLSFKEDNTNYQDISTMFNSLGTTLDIGSSNLSLNKDAITKEKTNTEAEKQKNVDYLEKKYSDLSNQFAEYNKIINSFELNFSALKAIINYKSNN